MREFLNKHKWTLVVTSLVILLPIAVGLLLWDKLPEQVPIHWGINGQVDRYASRAEAVFVMPAIMFVLQWLCALLSQLDPKKTNNKTMWLVMWIIPVLNLFFHVIIWLAAFGREINMAVIMPLFTGALFVIIGNYLPKCRHSYTVGIKLPWTLNDEANWNATHRLAGKLWVAGGLLTMPCALLSGVWAFVVMMSILVMMCAIPTMYSYQYYKKHKEDE